MTNDQLLVRVASILSRDKAKIKRKVITLISKGQREIYSKADFHWQRIGESFSVTAGEYQIDLREKFNDFMRLRFMWTINHAIEWWPEEKFRMQIPDDTGTGEPNKYFFHENNLIQLHPRPSVGLTIYATYVYLPDFNTLEAIPSQWDHVIENYVLAGFEKKDEFRFFNQYRDSLKDMVSRATPSQAETVEFLTDDYEITHYDSMFDKR